MSMSTATGHPTILIVGAAAAEPLDHCVDELRRAGQSTCVVGDVYAAMAMLARCPDLRHILVDVRPLDRAEAAFLSLAPRYFSSAEFAVALLEGTAERLESLGLACDCITPQAFVARAIAASGGRAAAAEATDGWELPTNSTAPVDASDEGESVSENAPVRTSPRPLSTDGGPEAAPEGPSLHDAVRARMQGLVSGDDVHNDPRLVRRRPPNRQDGK